MSNILNTLAFHNISNWSILPPETVWASDGIYCYVNIYLHSLWTWILAAVFISDYFLAISRILHVLWSFICILGHFSNYESMLMESKCHFSNYRLHVQSRAKARKEFRSADYPNGHAFPISVKISPVWDVVEGFGRKLLTDSKFVKIPFPIPSSLLWLFSLKVDASSCFRVYPKTATWEFSVDEMGSI